MNELNELNELRLSRASMTSKLEKICKRLDQMSGASVEWESHGILWSSEFVLKSLWVAGSYARGALDCGDLDLVAELASVVHEPPQGRHISPPGANHVNRTLFGSPRDVCLYLGTPEKNESGVELSEAVLIWRGKAHDWSAAISSIPLSPTAGRFPRATNRIPLRQEQLGCNIDALKKLVELEEQKIIQWKLLPLGDPAPLASLSSDESELWSIVGSPWGRKTQKLLPHLITYFRSDGRWSNPFLRSDFDKSIFGVGDAKVLLGRPYVPIHLLDDFATAQLLIVPHKSARGPNGIWSIERGDKHPLVLATTRLRVYSLFEEGEPFVVHRLQTDEDIGMSNHMYATTIDFFTSMRKARKLVTHLNEDDEWQVSARKLSYSELLSCIARVDVAGIDDIDYAVTQRGKYAIKSEKVCSASEILKALAG